MAAARFPIEEGSVLVFARALGDENPAYADGSDASVIDIGLPAPPTFVQASAQFDPDYPLRPQPGVPWFGSGSKPTSRPPGDDDNDRVGVGLHAEQHFEYHRPVRVGDVLSATSRVGESWEKEGRSGRLEFSETITEFRDAEGELVVTARSVSVLTRRVAEDDA